MAYYVRKIARAKWSLLEENTKDVIGNYKADTIANDMRTQGNTLSLWKVESLLEDEIEPVVVINSLLGDTVSKIELMFIPEEMLEGFSLRQSEGNTVVSKYRDLHYDVIGLSVKKHILFAKNIVLKVLAYEKEKKPDDQALIKRFNEKRQLEMIEKLIQQGDIEIGQLKEKQREAVLKNRERIQ